MKVLVTVKPVTYLKNVENYAYLIEVDLINGQITRRIKLPAASYKTECSFMTNFAQGMKVVGKDIYIAYWNYVIIIDYDTYTVKDAFSHPLMCDNHGIDSDGDRLYVTSTAIDSVLIFDIGTKELIDHWGASNKFLQPKRLLVPYSIAKTDLVKKWNSLAKKFKVHQITANFKNNFDYRGTHKSNSIYHNHHVNDVCFVKGDTILVTTKGWNDFENGSIIKLDTKTGQASFVSKPGSFKGLHDCVLANDEILVTESSQNSVGIQSRDGTINHKVLSTEPYFIRGLASTGNGFVVGFSSLREKNSPEAKVVLYDRSFEEVVSCVKLGNLYMHSKAAVHSIQMSPE